MVDWFLRTIYSTMMVLFLPVIFGRLWWKGRKNPGYRKRGLERLGGPPIGWSKEKSPVSIWFHAVSMGESIALWPTVLHFAKRDRVYVTTTTPAASEWVQNRIKSLDAPLADRVIHAYFPYDVPLFLNRVFDRFLPRLIIGMETELWWNWYHLAQKKHIPLIIMNGRISEKAYKRYFSFRFWTARVLAYPAYIGTDSEPSHQRFLNLGAPASRTKLVGNLKWDNPVPAGLVEKGLALSAKLSTHTRIWTAGSTHEAEEDLILGLQLKLKAAYPHERFLLFWVPRHKERFDAVFEKCQKAGLKVIRRSDHPHPIEKIDADVFLVDTMGELPLYYAASQWATIGATWNGIGGHNPLEALSLGVPVIVGPDHFGIEPMLQAFEKNDVQICRDRSLEALFDCAKIWVENPGAAKKSGEKAREVCVQFLGIRDRWHQTIEKFLTG